MTARSLVPGLLLVAGLVAVAGCAQTPAAPDRAVAAFPVVPADIERGQALAQRECSRCHAIAASGDSPAPMAPPFRRLASDVGGPALENRLRIVSELGHYEMRPAGLESADIRDLAAYIDSLD
ncbi:MAG: c-type cytochrome [Caulobacter sp.]|nr:c-type cytochrome [Caulobacter sp.]